MKPGDVIVTSHIRQYFWPAKGWAGYKASKDERFVFIFLGVEPRDGNNPLDPIKALSELGWILKDEK
jgi:hypothetical protein